MLTGNMRYRVLFGKLILQVEGLRVSRFGTLTQKYWRDAMPEDLLQFNNNNDRILSSAEMAEKVFSQ